jgi:hypothetical protein
MPTGTHVILADWKPPGVRKVIAFSAWSWVGLMDDGCSVLKYPRKEHDDQALQVLYDEAARYDHVGPHENLVPELHEIYQKEEVQARYRRGEYPLSLAEATGIDKVICQCWHSKYEHMSEVLGDLEKLDLGG